MQTHSTPNNMRNFLPTAAMVEAAQALYLAIAHLTLVRPIVLDYQTKILQKEQWPVREEYACFGKELILDPTMTYLLTDRDFVAFQQQCEEARIKAGLVVPRDGDCPLLTAENILLNCEHALIAAMAPVTGVDSSTVCGLPTAKYKDYIELTLRLMARHVGTAETILSRDKALQFIVSQGASVGIKQYQATAEENEIITMALESFGFLLRPMERYMQTKQYTFADFASMIETTYNKSEPRVAVVLATLRRVHARHAIIEAGDTGKAEAARRIWLASLQVGDEVEVPYSRSAGDIVRMTILSKDGGWMRLLPVGRRDEPTNWVKACSVNGWTKPLGITLQPTGVTSMQCS